MEKAPGLSVEADSRDAGSAANQTGIRPPSLTGPLSPAGALWLQHKAGNTAVNRLLARKPMAPAATVAPAFDDAPARQLLRQAVAARQILQRDCAGPAGCGEATNVAPPIGGTDDAIELSGKAKSVRKGKACEPARTISGMMFVPAVNEEVALATSWLQGSKNALTKQNIVLDIDVAPFLELGNLAFQDKDGSRNVDSYGTICLMMQELAGRRSKGGVVVLVVPFSGEICQGHGRACYVPAFGATCPSMASVLGRVPDKLIILGKFGTDALTLAHELGHHAGQPQRGDPTTYGHEEHDPKNYMGYDADRDHYRDELLGRMCTVPFDF